MKKLQKTIVIILIIGLVLSLNFNLFIFKPKTAKAVIPVAETASIPQVLKDIVLDTIGHTITQTILIQLQQKITDWGLGRKSAANKPFQIIDWRLFFAEAINRGSVRFIQEFDVAFDFVSGACEQGLKLKKALQNLGFGLYTSDLPRYSEYARPTLEDLGLEACQEFVSSGYSLIKGGWAGWFSLTMKPQNNIFSQVLMAERAQTAYQAAEKEAADKETAVGGGYQNEAVTTATDKDVCKDRCYANAPGQTEAQLDACLENCERLPGVPLQTRIKNWGSDIHAMMTNTLGSDMERLIGVDEITELLGVIFSALTNKALNIGLGWGSSTQQPTESDRTRVQTQTTYSYQREFKKDQTLEDEKDVKSQILSNILKAVQQLSRSATSCNEDEMMKYSDYAKNIADVFSNSMEALYVGLEGTNLKPDFEILDPPFAPFTVYGYSWGHVPAAKFPDKCKAITDQLKLGDNVTCRNIHSGLEPNYSLPKYSLQCEECIYDHDFLFCPPGAVPPQPYPEPGQEHPWPGDIITQKNEFYKECKTPYDTVLNRCEECVKNADEKCQELDTEAQKERCILNYCSNYADLIPHIQGTIADSLDFYNKCLVEEKKDACYTCLKEYFVPANYCEQIHDYMARSMTKYPALVKKEVQGALGEMLGANMWIGPYDKIRGAEGGVCDDNSLVQPIDLSLICRIMPDFTYGGQKFCETKCSQDGLTGQALTDALKDITDFRPNVRDCNALTLDIGGTDPRMSVIDGVFHVRGKCCGALWQFNAERYAACIGTGEPTAPLCTYAKPVEQEPWCYCDEGWRPLSFTRTGLPRVGGKGGDCHDDSFTLNTLTEVMGYTNNDPAGSMVYIASGGCTETDETCHNTTGVGLHDAPCTPSGVTDATGPSGVGFSQNTPGSKDNAPRNRKEWVIGNLWGNYHTGVYNNDNSDGATGWHVCAKCSSSDSGYPFYGNDEINQCKK